MMGALVPEEETPAATDAEPPRDEKDEDE